MRSTGLCAACDVNVAIDLSHPAHAYAIIMMMMTMMRWDKVARGALIVVCVRDLYHFINLFMLTFINSCFNVVLSKQAMAEEASGCAAMDTVSPVPSLRWRWNKQLSN